MNLDEWRDLWGSFWGEIGSNEFISLVLYYLLLLLSNFFYNKINKIDDQINKRNILVPIFITLEESSFISCFSFKKNWKGLFDSTMVLRRFWGSTLVYNQPFFTFFNFSTSSPILLSAGKDLTVCRRFFLH